MSSISSQEWADKKVRAKKLSKIYKAAEKPKTEQRSQLNKDIGKAIRERREAKKWTTYKLAEETGIQRSHLINTENGKVNPTISSLEKIAEALNCRLEVNFVRNKTEKDE
jgi:ribosome-binding protein aMBF1 (putative translation factor)